ncbi:MAG TPA: EVE domain-containing protein [Thermoanaerobaculia bacterium]|nr:EVE domain-containing protein [Thermoanaerobaculia bacterium]
MRYWINTVSHSHVQAGLAGGFTEAGHGTESRLKRLAKGDAIIFYSPRSEMGGGTPVQRFTAAGQVVDDAPWQGGEGLPWRRRVQYLQASETPVQPLIEQLEFIRNKKSWGVAFRRGFFEIGEADYARIVKAMQTAEP